MVFSVLRLNLDEIDIDEKKTHNNNNKTITKN